MRLFFCKKKDFCHCVIKNRPLFYLEYVVHNRTYMSSSLSEGKVWHIANAWDVFEIMFFLKTRGKVWHIANAWYVFEIMFFLQIIKDIKLISDHTFNMLLRWDMQSSSVFPWFSMRVASKGNCKYCLKR